MSLFNIFRPRKKIEPSEVRIGHRIVCSDGKTREVDVLHFMEDGRHRFWFTDDRWIEYSPGQKATVLR